MLQITKFQSLTYKMRLTYKVVMDWMEANTKILREYVIITGNNAIR